jgi:broad specificity phosphatase PhoE
VAVLLIRHAHAGSRKEWSGDDAARPLSEHGERQAEGLVQVLDRWVPARILSSPYRRCVQTVEPLAAKHSIGIEQIDALAEGSEADAIRLVRSLAGDATVALCTHGDVIAEVLVALADEERVDLGPRPKQAKGSVWVLESNAKGFAKARYFPPTE